MFVEPMTVSAERSMGAMTSTYSLKPAYSMANRANLSNEGNTNKATLLMSKSATNHMPQLSATKSSSANQIAQLAAGGNQTPKLIGAYPAVGIVCSIESGPTLHHKSVHVMEHNFASYHSLLHMV